MSDTTPTPASTDIAAASGKEQPEGWKILDKRGCIRGRYKTPEIMATHFGWMMDELDTMREKLEKKHGVQQEQPTPASDNGAGELEKAYLFAATDIADIAMKEKAESRDTAATIVVMKRRIGPVVARLQQENAALAAAVKALAAEVANARESRDTAIRLHERVLERADALAAELAKVKQAGHKLRDAAFWLASNAQGTPVPDWVDESMNDNETFSEQLAQREQR